MRNLIFLFFVVVGCKDDQQIRKHQGFALGTTYSVQYGTVNVSYDQIQMGIDSLFTIINSSMSTYLDDSDISKINLGDSLLTVDVHFKRVFEKSTEVWNKTEGYFDPTVGSWVNAYGFGPENKPEILTDQKKAFLQSITGWDKVKLTSEGTVLKNSIETYLDFNALAKGYTVDLLASYLELQGAADFLIEIGGEIVARGKNPKTSNPWRIAIDDPNQNEERKLIQTLTLKNQAIATSGNYRKYKIDKVTGERYVHSINPLNGTAVRSTVLSASVIASDCMTADAYATALMVMPLHKSIEMIETLPNIEAYWITASQDSIKQYFSKGWNK
ncbi:MAG: FAD:protein FMN transferase [Flavobacteriaceae bacterium]